MGQYDRKAQSQPKHGKPSDSGASKAPFAPSRGRPGWRGPSSNNKKVHRQPAPAPPPARAAPAPVALEHLLPSELQQNILDIFHEAFPLSDNPELLESKLCGIKDVVRPQDLNASGADGLLEAYAARWSAGRALAYANLLLWICRRDEADAWGTRLIQGNEGQVARAVCFGAGPAEIMAFAGLLRCLVPQSCGRPATSQTPELIGGSGAPDSPLPHDTPSPTSLLNLQLVATVDWSSVVSSLYTGLTTAPTLSKYASASARSANKSFLDVGALDFTFTTADIPEVTVEELSAMIGPDPTLLTILFTLNELFSVSISKASAFLLKLTAAAPTGSLLLIVDNSKSHCEVPVGPGKEGEEKRKYPMRWLMDHVLIPKLQKEECDEGTSKAAWEKVLDEESVWSGRSEPLTYPVGLQNMRAEIHLFRHL